MLDRVSDVAPAAQQELWPDGGLRWVVEPRKHAPGLDSLLAWAHRLGAERIGFQTGHPVWVKVHGRNRKANVDAINEAEIAQIVNHLYGADGMARLQGGNDFDTSYEIVVSRTERLRFRLNGQQTRTSRRDGANVVIRPIRDLPPSLEEQLVESGIMEAFRVREGMVMVSGATGSGKSTLIAGMTVAKLLDPEGHYNIVEAAAPVEFLLERIKSPCSTMNQSEIPRDSPTFKAFIRACMRREPSDIIIGECRDAETMIAAVDASISGHALATTTHAKNVPATMQRIVGLCPVNERENLIVSVAQSLQLVINQRLVESTDGKRTALREFLAFDSALQDRLVDTPCEQWPALTRTAVENQGQSFRMAIENALREGRISKATAEHELKGSK